MRLKRSLDFAVGEKFLTEGIFSSIVFEIKHTTYVFSTYLDDSDEYQITFDTLENIEENTLYKPVTSFGMKIFLLPKVLEKLLKKHIDEVGNALFYGLPATEELAKLYEILFIRYRKKADSMFCIRKVLNKNGEGFRYDIQYNQRAI